MPNRFAPISKGASWEESLPVVNGNFQQLDAEALTKVFNAATGNPGFIEGKLPNGLGHGFLLYTPDNKISVACYIDEDGEPVLKIAKEGYDATTATEDQLIFNSRNNNFKIVETGVANIPSGSRGAGTATNIDASKTFTNTYTTKPVVIGITTDDSTVGTGDIWGGKSLVPLSYTVGAGTGVTISIAEIRETITTTTGVTFRSRYLNGTGVSQTNPAYTIRYYVLRETAV